MGTNLFPIIYFVTLVTTNWQNTGNDFKREDGTNYVKQVQSISTNTYIYEVVLATNRTLYKRVDAPTTNSVTRWTPLLGPGLPPLPGQFLKE